MNSPSSSDLPLPSSGSAAIEDAAIAWLAERDDGFSPAREREFAQWLRADPRHAAAVARLEQTLGLLNELPQFRAEINTEFNRAAPVVPFPQGEVERPARVSRRWPRVLAWAGVAAVLALGVTVGWRALRPAAELRYTTTAAGYERARLDDGSTLELNAASAARVHFTAAERRVELEAGEAHFAVAHDAARPFVVSAGGVSVRAVGTAFNVRFTSQAVEVTVVVGKVAVGRVERVDPNALSARATSDPARWGQRTPPATTLLVANERLSLPTVPRSAAPVIEKVTPAALRQALAWQGRLVEFDEALLSEVILRFNARNRLQLILADAELGTRRIGGTFALDEAEAFVRLLERDGEIVAERRGETEIHLSRAR